MDYHIIQKFFWQVIQQIIKIHIPFGAAASPSCFLIADGDKVSPVEVKSSGYKAHTSLDAFCGKFSSRIRNKYLVYTKDMRKDGDVLYLPVYMTMFL